MNPTLIYSTTPTSGSQSIWRLLSVMAGTLGRGVEISNLESGGSQSLDDVPPADSLVMVRGVKALQGPIYDERFRYVVNFRDPRDMLCNQYHWLLQHPVNGVTDPDKLQKAKDDRAAMSAAGIDAYVLRHSSMGTFRHVLELAEAADKGATNLLFVSYVQLCCDYRAMVERLVGFLGAEVDKKAAAAIEAEAPEGLSANKKWIGNAWTGTDVYPGRYKAELKEETIRKLDERYGALLDRLAEIDRPELREFYAHLS